MFVTVSYSHPSLTFEVKDPNLLISNLLLKADISTIREFNVFLHARGLHFKFFMAIIDYEM